MLFSTLVVETGFYAGAPTLVKENVLYIEVENIETNNGYDWFGEREHAIGCTLTCAVSEKALVHKQILSGSKKRVQEIL